MRQTLRISIQVQLTLLLSSTWSCVEVCYDDEESKTSVCLPRVFNSPSPFLTRLISQICNPLLRFSSR